MEVVVAGLRYRGKIAPVGSPGSGVIEFFRVTENGTSTRFPALVARRVGTSNAFVWDWPSRAFASSPEVGTLVVFS